MRSLVGGREMKEIDRRSIEEYGIPSMVLMERAALAAADEAEALLRERGGRTVCAVCGFGNNGADGVAAARILRLRGFQAQILLPDGGGKQTEEFAAQLAIAERLAIPVYTVGGPLPKDSDVILDAVFGIGLTRGVEGSYAAMVSFIMEQKEEKAADVVAVDMPTGVHSDTGQLLGSAVFADVTVTFGELKLGQALFPGRSACGRLVVADIGFVPEPTEKKERHVFSLENCDLKRIPERRADSHKGTWGKVLVIGGAKNMAGAAYFSALAAYRCGAGLVKILTDQENRQILQERLPEALLSTYDASRAESSPEKLKESVIGQLAWADAIVLGPGLGRDGSAALLAETVLERARVPLVVDADALNLAAGQERLTKAFAGNMILTPHLKEMERLTGTPVKELRADLVGAAAGLADRYGVTCVLKDAATVIAEPGGKRFVNQSGSPAMAKGGSGDVLSGVIAGLLAIGMERTDAAALGVFLHGLAGEYAANKYGLCAPLAHELADCVGEVLKEMRWNQQKGGRKLWDLTGHM
ncbi:MAG: NAD(P)H-hydrate dehydratase [Lachnospiraceae bacterium]|nr:NAD(P)H-hydrate dehydratase [Lachnospiraceae bacterium]